MGQQLFPSSKNERPPHWWQQEKHIFLISPNADFQQFPIQFTLSNLKKKKAISKDFRFPTFAPVHSSSSTSTPASPMLLAPAPVGVHPSGALEMSSLGRIREDGNGRDVLGCLISMSHKLLLNKCIRSLNHEFGRSCIRDFMVFPTNFHKHLQHHHSTHYLDGV